MFGANQVECAVNALHLMRDLSIRPAARAYLAMRKSSKPGEANMLLREMLRAGMPLVPSRLRSVLNMHRASCGGGALVKRPSKRRGGGAVSKVKSKKQKDSMVSGDNAVTLAEPIAIE